jgi:hypothetical protein
MKRLCLLLCAALGAPLIASAQTARIVPAAADADAAAAALQYRSVFADTLPAAQPKQTPDKNWVEANRAVAGEITAPSGTGVSAPAVQAAAPAVQAAPQAPGAATGNHMHRKDR